MHEQKSVFLRFATSFGTEFNSSFKKCDLLSLIFCQGKTSETTEHLTKSLFKTNWIFIEIEWTTTSIPTLINWFLRGSNTV